MDRVLDLDIRSGGFELLVDVGKSEPVACVVLAYPNNTQVTVRGDEEVVKQIVDRLDGQIVEYTPPAVKP